MDLVTHTDESCHKYEQAMSYTAMRHDRHIDESFTLQYLRVVTSICTISHVTRTYLIPIVRIPPPLHFPNANLCIIKMEPRR